MRRRKLENGQRILSSARSKIKKRRCQRRIKANRRMKTPFGLLEETIQSARSRVKFMHFLLHKKKLALISCSISHRVTCSLSGWEKTQVFWCVVSLKPVNAIVAELCLTNWKADFCHFIPSNWNVRLTFTIFFVHFDCLSIAALSFTLPLCLAPSKSSSIVVTHPLQSLLKR